MGYRELIEGRGNKIPQKRITQRKNDARQTLHCLRTGLRSSGVTTLEPGVGHPGAVRLLRRTSPNPEMSLRAYLF